MPTTPTRFVTLALLLATILISAHPADASGRFSRKGPYLALAPYTQAIHLDMEYTLADFETHTSTSEWRTFWRAGAGWAWPCNCRPTDSSSGPIPTRASRGTVSTSTARPWA